MNRDVVHGSRECIERIRAGISDEAFGYKVQALAAHVLLRLGHQIGAVNQSGHPDIATTRDGREFRFEVEAEAKRPRLRKPTDADFTSLLEATNGAGYYALAISFPKPKWVLVQASKLAGRTRASPNMLFEALSDKDYSREWTREYQLLLHDSCQKIRMASFRTLCQMAITGHGL